MKIDGKYRAICSIYIVFDKEGGSWVTWELENVLLRGQTQSCGIVDSVDARGSDKGRDVKRSDR